MAFDRDRARKLIEAVHSGATLPEPDDGARAMLVFESAGLESAVDAALVEAVTRASYIAPVPYAPAGVLGVASVRGRMRIVVDAGGARPESGAYLVILAGDGHLALLADRIVGVRRVAPGELDSLRILDPDGLLEG